MKIFIPIKHSSQRVKRKNFRDFGGEPLFINTYEVKSHIIQIHVTSPFLLRETIVEAEKFMEEYDSVVACNIYQSRFWRQESYGYCPVNHNPVRMEQTQDLPTLYEENSAFYIFDPNIILDINSRVGVNPYFYGLTAPENRHRH